MQLQLFHTGLFESYLEHLGSNMQQVFNALQDAELSTPNCSFYTSVASVYSSKIEGEDIALDSYIKHKRDQVPFQPDYTKKVDDLYAAYLFAQANPLNADNVKQAHQLLSKHFVATGWQGKYRMRQMYVTTDDGRIEYVAAELHAVKGEMERFFADVQELLDQPLSVEATFYFAAMIHLVFAKIHPWMDGNSKTARLVEKWFIADKLGAKAWFLQSEKIYYQQHDAYYRNLRRWGLEYDTFDSNNALPFLLMLPQSLLKV